MDKYDSNLVNQIQASKQAPTLLAKELGVDVQLVMAILRDGNEHGWDAIKGDQDWLDDDEPEEIVMIEEDMSPALEPDVEAEDVPDLAVKQAQEVEEKIATASRRKKTKVTRARGQKPANTKKTKGMNRERRRRKGGDPGQSRRRLIADLKKFNPDFDYRWVLDRPGRIKGLEADDWDIVTDAHMEESMGGNVTAVAGTNHYNADNMVLMRKWKDWRNEDQEEKLAGALEFEAQINGQQPANGSTLVDRLGSQQTVDALKSGGLDLSNTYVPAGEKNRVGQVS